MYYWDMIALYKVPRTAKIGSFFLSVHLHFSIDYLSLM